MPSESVSGEELQILVQYQLVAALQEREHDLATAQRLAHLGSWSMDMATGVVTWSDELYRIFGLSEEGTTPGLEAFMSVVHPDERSAVENAVREALAARTPFRLQYRIRRPDGQERLVLSSGAVDVDAENVIIRIHGMAQDVTDIAAAQRAEPNGSGTEQRVLDAKADPGRGGQSEAERALRRALDEGQFLLHYQPKVSIESDLITGAEARHQAHLRPTPGSARCRCLCGWRTPVRLVSKGGLELTAPVMQGAAANGRERQQAAADQGVHVARGGYGFGLSGHSDMERLMVISQTGT